MTSLYFRPINKYEFKIDNRRHLPYAKPGVQRRADVDIMKPADELVPIVQLPENPTPSLNNESTPNESIFQPTPSTSKSNVPIPLAIN